MNNDTDRSISSLIGRIPFRLALAGGWIDQPFVSRHNPTPPGSMVVVAVEPTFPWMDRCGIAGSTRRIARELWGDTLPDRDPAALVEELYHAENQNNPNTSGSQDMIGLIYPGVNRLDYEVGQKGGFFPAHIESNHDPAVARWLERVIHILPVAPRPDGYNPRGIQNLEPAWVRRLGQSGKDCYAAILARDACALGASFNECMACWEAIMPHIVRHPTVKTDLVGIMKHYQERYAGAMYSGCGGGYLFIVSEEPVPGTFQVQVRLAKP